MTSSVLIDIQEDVLTATISGKIDGQTAPDLQTQLMGALGPAGSAILDVRNVPYMSSAGFRMLLLLHRAVSMRNGQAMIVGLQDEIRDTMEMTGFLDFFLLFDTVEKALEQVRNNAATHASTR